jgi:hypothetical protein
MMIDNSEILDSRRPTRRHALMLFGVGATALSQPSVLASQAPQFPKGAVIRTVLKDLSPELVTGETLFHEHLSVAYSRTERHGGHPDMGRNLEQLKQIARETSVYIVGSTGFYLENNYPAEIATMSENQIADELVRQANEEWLGHLVRLGSRTIHPNLPLRSTRYSGR